MSDPAKIVKALIVDDEELARVNLRHALSQHKNWNIVAECTSVENAQQALTTFVVDVLFLDIHMPGISGLELARQLSHASSPPVIIFVTAYDRYAIAAFECYALDYLLKPFSDERLTQALHRALDAVKLKESHSAANSTYGDILRAYADSQNQADQVYAQQLVLRSAGEIALLPIEQVRYITAAGNYVELHTAQGNKLLRHPINKFAQTLDPHIFIRTHRSNIVRIADITSLSSLADGSAKLTLACGTQLAVSASYVHNVRACMLISTMTPS